MFILCVVGGVCGDIFPVGLAPEKGNFLAGFGEDLGEDLGEEGFTDFDSIWKARRPERKRIHGFIHGF